MHANGERASLLLTYYTTYYVAFQDPRALFLQVFWILGHQKREKAAPERVLAVKTASSVPWHLLRAFQPDAGRAARSCPGGGFQYTAPAR